MVQQFNRSGIRVIIPLFDRCHGEDCKTSPWRKNRQGVSGLYGANNSPHRYAVEHVERMIAAMAGLDVAWEVENEPFDLRFPSLHIMVRDKLFAAGYPREKLIHGCDFVDAPPGQKKYYWKDFFIDPLGPDYRRKCASPLHNVNGEKLDYLCKFQKANPQDGRRFLISDDGNRPKWTRGQWRDALIPWLRKNANAFELRYYIESCPAHGEMVDVYSPAHGIQEAIDTVFAELWPVEPEDPPVDPPNPPDPPEDPDPPNPPDEPEDPEPPTPPDNPDDPEEPVEPPVDPPTPPEPDKPTPAVDFAAWVREAWAFLLATGSLLWQMVRFTGYWAWQGIKSLVNKITKKGA
jgi:hypothetical protein